MPEAIYTYMLKGGKLIKSRVKFVAAKGRRPITMTIASRYRFIGYAVIIICSCIKKKRLFKSIVTLRSPHRLDNFLPTEKPPRFQCFHIQNPPVPACWRGIKWRVSYCPVDCFAALELEVGHQAKAS